MEENEPRIRRRYAAVKLLILSQAISKWLKAESVSESADGKGLRGRVRRDFFFGLPTEKRNRAANLQTIGRVRHNQVGRLAQRQ